MAIAFDSKTATTTSATASLSFSHTCTGTDRILFVITTANGAAFTTTGVTYNSVSMTIASSFRITTGPIQYIWYLINPASGSNTIQITNSGSVTAGSAISFNGVKQTGFPDASITNSGATGSTSYNSTVTTIADNSFILSSSRTNAGLAFTAGANTTVGNQPEATYFGGGGCWYSTAPQTPAGAKTLNVTCSAQDFDGAMTISFAPETGGGGATYRRMALLGVGN
jgi:hypothetical protein